MIKGLETKVVVVGGGPVGLYAAYLIKKENPKLIVTLVELKKQLSASGCSGHVSIKGINDLVLASLIDLDKITINRIRGAEIYSPDKTNLKVRTKQFQTIVLDRNQFDKEIETLAKKAGVEILYGHQVMHVDEDYIRVNLLDEDRIINIDYNYLIGADGPNSIVRKSFPEKTEISNFVNTYQITATGNFNKDMVNVYFGNFSSGFFGWVIPTSPVSAMIGVGTTLDKNPKEALDAFIKEINLKFSDIKFKSTGLIPITKPLSSFFYKNKFLIGDAACFVKATSGGGLVFGLKSAEILAKTFNERFKKFKNINSYDVNLKKLISELNLHYKIYSYIHSQTTEELDQFFKKLKKVNFEDFLNNFGNIDYPSKIIPYLLLRPKYLVFYEDFKKLIKS